MSDDIIEEPEEDASEPSFAELFEAYSAGMNDDIKIGDKIKGKIISIGTDAVYVDTGSKTDGVVDRVELLDESGEMTVAVGDAIDLYVVAMTESDIKLSRAMDGLGGYDQLLEAYESRVPVTGKVTETCKGGFRVEVFKRRAFCPISQIDLNYADAPEKYVGETFEFRIITLEESGRNIVVSRKALLAEAAKAAREVFFAQSGPGDVVQGVVTRLAPFGAFVELATGVEGMVHISELSWSRIESPEAAVASGDRLSVKILAVEDDDKGRKRIRLSARQAQGDPWSTVSQQFAEGQKVTGTVTRLAKFGAFVAIAPGIEGLVHISEMSYTRRIVDPADVATEGAEVSVMIKTIDEGKRRISLSMKDAEGDPWLGVAERYRAGAEATGTVEKLERFGIFISLEPGIVGLLPKSSMAQSADPGAYERAKPGQSVAVRIDRVDAAARRISLTPADAEVAGGWQAFAPTEAEKAPLNELAQKLQDALNKSK
ncbi:MAG: 30S ribosomal protein S1 [Pseudomonadota bacterium]